jgi:adenylate cyclase
LADKVNAQKPCFRHAKLINTSYPARQSRTKSNLLQPKMKRHVLVRQELQRGFNLPPWLDRLLASGIVSSDPDVVRRQRLVNVGVLAVAGNAASHLIFNAAYDFQGLLPIHLYNAVMMVAPLLLMRLHRLGENVSAVALALFIVVAHMFIVWAMGIASDLHVYFTFASAFLLLVGVQNWRLFLVVFVLYLAALLVALNFAPLDGFISPEDRELRALLSTHAMVNLITINAILLFYALTAMRRAELQSEALITAVLPPSIAERLKSGNEERIADRIETLTVMFADLVGFTEAAHHLPPEEVVDFLDRLVRVFDAQSEQYGVEKIKTIGDSYMAAAGFDGRGRDGARATGRLALAMLEAIGRQPALGTRALRLRIGIHCGPATAGVIGDERFSYDVWGDAVNVAARMESNGEPGKIHVSESFRSLAGDYFEFDDQGTTELKGVGVVRSYFLRREKS